jgi:hypothetical protein
MRGHRTNPARLLPKNSHVLPPNSGSCLSLRTSMPKLVLYNRS